MPRHPMSDPRRAKVSLASATAAVCASLLASSALAQVQQPPTSGDRLLGLDVSAHQGNISQTTWNNFYSGALDNGEQREFVFIRASRGGTTGEDHRQGGYPAGNNTFFNLSQRYDDPYFIQNITNATNAGMLAGSYHFGRMDVIESTTNSGGIRNTGTDEANHFLQMAGAWMRPGYLLPTFDLEAGLSNNTANELAQFAIDFSDRIYAVKGIRPAVYIGGNYAADIATATAPLPANVVAALPTLWSARWPTAGTFDVQTDDPGDFTSTVYGHWDNVQGPDPWKVWQYTSTGRLQSFNNGGSNLDFDVAHGNIEFVKDMQVPALWTKKDVGGVPIDGLWTDLTNWNSGEAAVQPVPGSGQLAPVGVNWNAMKPQARLPGAEDNVDLNLPTANVAVTLSSGTHNIRRLNVNERLNMTGGSLDARLTGQVGAGGTLSLSGGVVTFTEGYVTNGGVLEFSGAGTLNVGTLFLGTGSSVTYTGSAGTGVIQGKAGVGIVDLQGTTRTFAVNEGSGLGLTDLRIAIPLTNGNLTKTGTGTLELTGNNSAYGGTLFASGGNLRLSNAMGTGTTVRTSSSGAIQVNGNGLNFSRLIELGGRGFNSAGALQNIAGNNTWSGQITLVGTEHNLGNQQLNYISAAANTTLTLSGLITQDNNTTGVLRSWAKIGAGDVVLAGGTANNYQHLTRLFAGRLIIEKDGALGAGASNTTDAGNTFQLGGVESTLAFRNGVNYTTNEWIFTDGLGSEAGVFGQIDSLGGANKFAGHLGLGGPTVNTVVESYLGVNTGSLELSGKIYAKSQTGPQVRNIVKRGVGTLILSGDSSGTPTNNGQLAPPNQGHAGTLTNSSFTVGAGTVQLKGTAGNTANLPGVTSWKMNTGGTLDINKINAAGNAELVLNGGKLSSSLASLSLSNTLRTDSAGTGGNVEVAGAASVLTHTAQFNNSAGKTVRKQLGGTWNINGAQTHAANAAFINEGGTTNFNTDAGSLAAMNLSLTVNSSTIVNFTTNQHLNSLNVNNAALATLAAGNNKVVRTKNLTLTGNAELDLNDNDLVVDYAVGGPSPYATIKNYSINGYRFGFGLTSTTGAAAGDTVLAIVDNAQFGRGSWAGENIDTSTIIGKYTYFGDANMDGKVTGVDYGVIDANIGLTDAQWLHGDFNFDGNVTGVDYGYIDANIGQGVSDPLMVDLQQQMIAQHTAMFGDAYVNSLNAALAGNFEVVPEPSALGLLAFTGLLLRRKRR